MTVETRMSELRGRCEGKVRRSFGKWGLVAGTEGGGFAGSDVIAEVEESVGAGGADDVAVEEGSAIEGGAPDAEDRAIGAEDVGDRSKDRDKAVVAEASLGEDVLAREGEDEGFCEVRIGLGIRCEAGEGRDRGAGGGGGLWKRGRGWRFGIDGDAGARVEGGRRMWWRNRAMNLGWGMGAWIGGSGRWTLCVFRTGPYLFIGKVSVRGWDRGSLLRRCLGVARSALSVKGWRMERCGRREGECVGIGRLSGRSDKGGIGRSRSRDGGSWVRRGCQDVG